MFQPGKMSPELAYDEIKETISSSNARSVYTHDPQRHKMQTGS